VPGAGLALPSSSSIALASKRIEAMTKSAFILSRVSGMPVADEELKADLRRVASELNKMTVGQKEYRVVGRFDDTTISTRFGSWNKGLAAAGLDLANEMNIPDDRLFENILVLWQHYGRQPRRNELSRNPSTISQGPYRRRFKSWTAALEAFVKYANGSVPESRSKETDVKRSEAGTSPRDPSLRLRWRVLQRDRFSCRACGRSPALVPGLELHVDHIRPWSKGGDTVLTNLQALCSACNIGKSNVNS
jgi:5-methylcytosine-specific restriction endonuclease McrA